MTFSNEKFPLGSSDEDKDQARSQLKVVTLAHILPRSSSASLVSQLLLTGLVDSPRNVLFLRRDIEQAFDNLYVSFVPKNTDTDFPVQLFVWAPVPFVTEEITELFGRELNVSDVYPPYSRALAFQLACARHKAVLEGWIPADAPTPFFKNVSPAKLLSRLPQFQNDSANEESHLSLESLHLKTETTD